ncbi:hypothetical protein PAE9249_05303 [Paenibacillus sp. CECT 9249]|uniref:DUF4358 domain-containing protein n=1 Tax=Paenibacillus sp. CECT 9249 TaxID=2845385 RepID=UPI001E2B6B27|nr:DUF4358 domain-containing protein [Paenibacillus sp. CECT 9249]CAH0122714.1 hypothetical protein PAE9249_05303 [Paenibacillus sp. CECT 9249]
MKQYNRKLAAALVAFALAIGLLTGCSGKGDGDADKLSAAVVGERIGQAVSLNDMKQGDAKKLQKLYHIDAEDVEDFVLYTATSNVKADELAVIKVKDKNQVESVKAKLLQRIDAQTVKFKDYRPEEYFLIEKHVLKTKGPFILFAVSQEADRMERAFDEAFSL